MDDAAPGAEFNRVRVVDVDRVVVAGESDTIVRIPGQPLPAVPDVVVLDVHNDVAVLRVSGVDLQPLSFADPRPGASVAIANDGGGGRS